MPCICSIIFTVGLVSYLLLMMQSWASLSRSWACEACSDNSSWDRHPDVPNVPSSWDPDSHKVCQKPHSTHRDSRTETTRLWQEWKRQRGREGVRGETADHCQHTHRFKCSYKEMRRMKNRRLRRPAGTSSFDHSKTIPRKLQNGYIVCLTTNEVFLKSSLIKSNSFLIFFHLHVILN